MKDRDKEKEQAETTIGVSRSSYNQVEQLEVELEHAKDQIREQKQELLDLYRIIHIRS